MNGEKRGVRLGQRLLNMTCEFIQLRQKWVEFKKKEFWTWVERLAPDENPPRVIELGSIVETVGKVLPPDVGGGGKQPFTDRKSPKRQTIKNWACILYEM